jgi:hypothetical protein
MARGEECETRLSPSVKGVPLLSTPALMRQGPLGPTPPLQGLSPSRSRWPYQSVLSIALAITYSSLITSKRTHCMGSYRAACRRSLVLGIGVSFCVDTVSRMPSETSALATPAVIA